MQSVLNAKKLLSTEPELPDYILDAQYFIELATNDGIDTTSAQNLLEGAKRAFIQNRPKKARAMANLAKREAKRGFNTRDSISIKVSYANRCISAVEENIGKVRKLGLDISKPQQLLMLAKEAKTSRNYDFSVNCLKEAESEINVIVETSGKVQQTSDLIHNASEIIHTIKNRGLDVHHCEILLSSANSAFESKDYLEGQILAMQAIKNAVSKVTRVEEGYIPPPPPPPPPVEVTLDPAEASQETFIVEPDEAEPIIALEEPTSEAAEIEEVPVLHLGAEKKVKRLLIGVQSLVKKAQAKSLDVTEIEEKLEIAKDELRQKQYQNAMELLLDAKKKIKDQMAAPKELKIKPEPKPETDIVLGLSDLTEIKALTESIGIDAGELGDAIIDIKTNIKKNDIDNAVKILQESYPEIDNKFQEHFNIEVTNDHRRSFALIFYPPSENHGLIEILTENMGSLESNYKVSSVKHNSNSGDYPGYVSKLLTYFIRNGIFLDKMKLLIYLRAIEFQEDKPVLVIENNIHEFIAEQNIPKSKIITPEELVLYLPGKLKKYIYYDETNSTNDMFGYLLLKKSMELLKNPLINSKVCILNIVANKKSIEKGLLFEVLEELFVSQSAMYSS